MNKSIIYAISVILAAFSIVYELLIAQTLSILAGNTVVWYSLTIGLYLGAMGVGAMLCDKLWKKQNIWEALFKTEILLAIIGGVSVMAIHIGHILKNYHFVQESMVVGSLIFFSLSFSVIFAIGFLSGFELPLLIRAGNESSSGRREMNKILAFNYLGSLLGAIAFPLVLVSNFGVISISIGVALLNGIVAIIILWKILRKGKRFAVKLNIAGLVMVLLLYCAVNIGAVEQYFLKKYYYYKEASESFDGLFGRMDDFPEVQRIHSPYQKIDIVKFVTPRISDFLINAYSSKYEKDPDYPKNYGLFLNGDYQFISNYEDVYHEHLVHVPIILNKEIPKKVLVIGGGDGLVDRELLKYSEIESITHVDIDPEMIKVAMENPILKNINKGSLEDPKVNLQFADGYFFLKNSKEKFDAIYLDLPTPLDYNISRLYSREFYSFALERLNDDGFLAMDAPGTFIFYLTEGGNRSINPEKTYLSHYSNTLKSAGFGTVLPYVSGLELSNHGAAVMINDMIDKGVIVKGSAENNQEISDRKSAIEDLIKENISTLREGYIIAKKGQLDKKLEYSNHGIDFNVLNQQRFLEAISMEIPGSGETDRSRINSIIKPTLPDLPFWFTKLPYYE